MPSVIALDAMGSDRAPKPEIEGAIHAARHYGVHVVLVGREPLIRAELGRVPAAASLPIQVIHASEVIAMEDKAVQAVRAKRDSSLRVGLRLVRERKAAGFVTAGNTGAAMATAKMVLGGLPGVDRPALAAVIPTAVGTVAILVRATLKESLKATITRQVGYLLSRSAFADFKKRLDHTEYGGAPLLGVKGVCFITHGSSNANAIKNAIRVAAEFAELRINDKIEKELAQIPAAVT